MLADATIKTTSGTGQSFMVFSSTWSTIFILCRQKCSILSSRVFLSALLYSTAVTLPSDASIAASMAILSPLITQILSCGAIVILFRMIERISLPT